MRVFVPRWKRACTAERPPDAPEVPLSCGVCGNFLRYRP
ncbi:hypothetical protein AKJ09_02063 [Labilithrix luteola]|uniref:Uncharacterized protein n=1 Tax=Labilithrix luteola TaxID=1391654 RepID=A0A0K1PQK6_9BACT|nr:hypothetical protein AKJ09_02063 [Labilithrix luteola]